MNRNLKKVIGITTTAVAGMYIINRIVDYTAGQKNLLNTEEGNIYHWKNGNIFYTVSGKGTPVVLIHELNPASSAKEWSKIVHRLEKKHTVYTIDLLGCGRSEKPGITYTNFLYVQLINNFIHDIIKEAANIVVTGISSSFVIMAQAMEPDNFKKIILVNPSDINIIREMPTKETKAAKTILEIPILGTFIYNLIMHHKRIRNYIESKYFFKKTFLSSKLEDTYFESAHKGNSAGKYLLASTKGNYINIDITNAVKKADNLYIISSRERNNAVAITEKYLHLNKNIEATYISNSRYLPQLETPDKFKDIVLMFLQ